MQKSSAKRASSKGRNSPSASPKLHPKGSSSRVGSPKAAAASPTITSKSVPKGPPTSLPPIASPTGSLPSSPVFAQRATQDTDYDSSPKSTALTRNSPKKRTEKSSAPALARPTLEELKNKQGQMKLVSHSMVDPWSQVKVKWRILEGGATDVFLAMYKSSEEDLRRYDASVVCHDRVAATSVMVAPVTPGFYTIKLVREEESGIQVLAFKGFQVISPLEKDSHKLGAAGVWRAEPETDWPEDALHEPAPYQALQAAMAELRTANEGQQKAMVGGLRIGAR